MIDRSKPILVTGANGYVASWLVKRLLDEGLTVHAAVRNPDNEAKVGHLKEVAEKSKGELFFLRLIYCKKAPTKRPWKVVNWFIIPHHPLLQM